MLNWLLQEFYPSPNNGKQIVSLGEDRRLLIDHSALSGPGRINPARRPGAQVPARTGRALLLFSRRS